MVRLPLFWVFAAVARCGLRETIGDSDGEMNPIGKGMSMGVHPADSARASTAPPSPSSSSAASSAAGGTGAAPGGAAEGEISPPASPGRRRKRSSASPARPAASPEPAPSRAAAAPAAPAAAPAPAPAVRGHKTWKVKPLVYEVPTLGYLCVQLLAEHSDSIVDLRGVGEDTARQLLREIMDRQKLTYPLAKVFMDCGDDELSSAIGALNLWDAIPAGRQGRHSRHL